MNVVVQWDDSAVGNGVEEERKFVREEAYNYMTLLSLSPWTEAWPQPELRMTEWYYFTCRFVKIYNAATKLS